MTLVTLAPLVSGVVCVDIDNGLDPADITFEASVVVIPVDVGMPSTLLMTVILSGKIPRLQ